MWRLSVAPLTPTLSHASAYADGRERVGVRGATDEAIIDAATAAH
jgi:hypothetical protein